MPNSDVLCLGIIVNRISDALLKPGFRHLRYLLFYKGLLNDLRSELEKLKIQKELVDKRAVKESVGGKIINQDVQVWRQDVDTIINDLENFLKCYQEKGSKMHFKDLPFPKPVSLNRLEVSADNPANENVAISDTPHHKIEEAEVTARFRRLRYLLWYKAFVNGLSYQIERVKILNGTVARRVETEREAGKIIDNRVTDWQEDVQKNVESAEELLRQIPSWTCFKFLQFPDPVSRFRLGKKAASLEQIVADLTISGKMLLDHEIAYLPAIEDANLSNNRYQKFASREEVYGKLCKALFEEDGEPVIGIYGMAGVGKTLMIEEAAYEAWRKGTFDRIITANLGAEKIDVIKLQDQIARYLGCHFDSVDNEVRRAYQLKYCLNNERKTLIIFDDVWDAIPLKNIGIPLGDDSSKGSKILLASRRYDVCMVNNCQDPLQLQILTEEEAWEMFTNIVGTSKIASFQDPSLAKRVCRQCQALPLLINTVGNALKSVNEKSWNEALFQLENSISDDGIQSQVYTSIQLSFDKLTSASKACLMLCSLFEEDDDIDINMLLDLATGSQLLNRGRNISGLIDILKSSCLLLEGHNYHTVKMNGIIRDVARSIAARDPQYAFLYIRSGPRFPEIVDYSTRKLLQLHLEADNVCFPDDLVCPDVHTLWLQCKKHSQEHLGSFFQGLINLRVLVIKGMSFSYQLSIRALDKLRVLILDGCNIHQTFLNSVSRNLETLSIHKCDLPDPLDLPEFINLTNFELFSSTKIVMLPNAISRVSSLEELKIPGGFEISEGYAISISAELSNLTRLRTLMFHFDDCRSLIDEDIIHKLIGFDVSVGSRPRRRHNLKGRYSKSISLECIDDINGRLVALVEGADEVNLFWCHGFPDGFIDMGDSAFQYLRRLLIVGCDDMCRLAWSPEYYHMQRLNFLCKLSIVEIISCRRLKFLFSATIAKNLVQMKELIVDECPMMETIINADGEIDWEVITFPNLKLLVLQDLPILTSFYNDKPSMHFSSEEITNISGSSSFFSEKLEFPALEKLVIYNIGNEGELWANETLKQKYAKITTLADEGDTAVE